MQATPDPDHRKDRTARSRARPADLLMTPERLGAFWPSPLSFSRSLLRDLARQGCAVRRESFALDAQGEGSAVYRVTIGSKLFSYCVLSCSVPDEEKTDRVIGVKWDVMAALMAGEPTPERLAALRRELPKQKVGRADGDTLVWLRANKSMRAFRHTVSRLAEGLEPDPSVLMSTGYLLRTTAFYANGKLGTIAFEGLRQLGALYEPYHAQIMSAWLLREFSFDLVEHLARAGSKLAVPLSPQARRMSGVGNSAGVGIVPFILRHPRIIDGWVRAHESLLARIRAETVEPDGVELARFSELLARAELYFDALPEQDGGHFVEPRQIAAELRRAAVALGEMLGEPLGEAGVRGRPIAGSRGLDLGREHVCAETQEALNVIVMELYPGLVEAAQRLLTVEEELWLRPGMTLSELKLCIEDKYGWVGEVLARNDRRDVFWYRSDEAGEPRIADRGASDWSRREVFMDLAIQIAELRRATEPLSPDMEIADFLLQRPDLYEAVRRAEADLSYGEVRANLVDGRLAPLPLIRFVLAFYGMERFTPGSTRWVRGTFLQGAPTAEDLAQGQAGDWPFPVGWLAPLAKQRKAGGSVVSFRAEKQNLEGDGKRSIEIKPSYGYTLLPLGDAASVRVALPELSYLCELALRSAGMPQGAAQKAGELTAFAEIVAGSGLSAVAQALGANKTQGQGLCGFPGAARQGALHSLSCGGLGLTHFAPYLLEKAQALVGRSPSPVALRIEDAGPCADILPGLALELAGRNVGVVAVMQAASPARSAPGWMIVAALPSAQGGERLPDLLTMRVREPVRALREMADGGMPSPRAFFEPGGPDFEAAGREALWLWLTKSPTLIAEARIAAAIRARSAIAIDGSAESCTLEESTALAARRDWAQRFGLELPVSLLAPVVEAADKVLLASSEEGSVEGGKTASWGNG